MSTTATTTGIVIWDDVNVSQALLASIVPTMFVQFYAMDGASICKAVVVVKMAGRVKSVQCVAPNAKCPIVMAMDTVERGRATVEMASRGSTVNRVSVFVLLSYLLNE